MTTQRKGKLFATVAPMAAAAVLAGGLVVASDGNGDGSVAAAANAPTHVHAKKTPKKANQVSLKQLKLHRDMRTLWDQHMQWTYDTVVAFASGSEGLDATVARLLQNQVHIGNAIKPYYGAPAAKQLTALLQDHITLAVPVLTAAKAGDTAALNTAVANWYKNANDIGVFLAKANPRWKGVAQNMMKMHITQTVKYAGQILTGQYAKAITTYDRAQAHMQHMGDALADGIIAAFPKKF